MSGEWREPADIAADLASTDPTRRRAGVVAFLEFTKTDDAFDFALPPVEWWVIGAFGPGPPADLAEQLARMIPSYLRFEPDPPWWLKVRQVVELGLRFGPRNVLHEAALAARSTLYGDPVESARDVLFYLRMRGLRSQGEIERAIMLVGHLLDGAPPVRRATTEALAAWPDVPTRTKVVAGVLMGADPDQRPLLRRPPDPPPLPSMTFADAVVDRRERFSVGVEQRSGRHYVAIPATNGLVDYEEYFAIDEPMFARFTADPAAALPFVRRARERWEDPRLLYQPSIRRGSAT
jgi:hypothetical protein